MREKNCSRSPSGSEKEVTDYEKICKTAPADHRDHTAPDPRRTSPLGRAPGTDRHPLRSGRHTQRLVRKPFAVFGLPCLLAAVHLLTVCITLADPKRKNIQHRLLMLVFWIVPAVSIVISGLIYLNALSIPVDTSAAVLLLVGALYIVLGVCMPKLRQNYTVGIKLPWTLNSTENWKRTHCLGGKVLPHRRGPDHPLRPSRQDDQRRFRADRCGCDHGAVRSGAWSLFVSPVPERI